MLKRLTYCSYAAGRVPRHLASLTAAIGDKMGAALRVHPAWEHRAPGKLSDYRRWSTTDPLAENAGWTEVVIPRGPRVLIDLPVGRWTADMTSLSWWWHATYPGGSPVYPGGVTTTVSDQFSGDTDVFSAVAWDGGTRGFRSFVAVGSVGCPNNYEVTL